MTTCSSHGLSRENTCEERSLHCVIYTQQEPLKHIPASQGVLSIIWIVISDNLTARSGHVPLQLHAELNQQHPVLPQPIVQRSMLLALKGLPAVYNITRIYGKAIYSTSRFNLQRSTAEKNHFTSGSLKNTKCGLMK